MSAPKSPLATRIAARLPFDAHGLLTPPVRRFYLATVLGTFGGGLVLSLFVIYLVHVRHFSVLASTALLAWESIVGLAISPLFGSAVDRFGPSRVLVVTMSASALGVAALAFISTLPAAFAVATVTSVGGAGTWGALTVLLTRFVAEERRQDAFGVNFMLINLGIGLGALCGTSIANIHNLRSFQALYLACGAILLVQAGVIFTLRSHGGPPAAPEHHEQAQEGWSEVLADRRLLRFLAVSVLLAVCGYGSIEAGMQLFVVNVLHLPLRAVGLTLFFNTGTIVVAQIFVLGGIKGKSRSMMIGLVGLCWGLSWALAASSLLMGAVAAVIALCVGQIVFALGETVWAPVAPALVNDLAAEHLRGRYNALNGVVWQTGGTVGPLIAGLFLAGGHGAAWTITLMLGALLGGLGATTMRRVLTAAEDGRVVPTG